MCEDIEETVATMARIPPKSGVEGRIPSCCCNLESDLKTVVFGQDACDRLQLSAAIKLARAGLREPEKPIGSLPAHWSDRRRQDRGDAKQAGTILLGRGSACGSTCRSTWSGTASRG
jgi:hypothetical protein